MEVAAPSRKRGQSSDEDLQTVRNKRRTKNKSLPTTTTSAPAGQRQERSLQNRLWFLCSASEHFPTAYHVVKAVDGRFDLLFEVKPTLSGQFLVKPKDDKSLRVLSSIKKINGKPLHIVQKEASSLQKAVVCGFPQEFGLCLLSRLDNIHSPMRMKSGAGVETKQVSVFFKGEILEFIDLASWGHFAVRSGATEVLQVSAVGPPPTALHAPCSGAHNTTHWHSFHKRKKKTAACCPNCGGKHHAWNLGCPSRKAQVSRMHNRHEAKQPKQSSKKEETNQGKKGE